MASHGARANKSGAMQERAVLHLMEDLRFKQMTHVAYQKAKEEGNRPDRVIIKNMPYTTLYGSKGKTEFFIYAKELDSTKVIPLKKAECIDFECRIECKCQTSSGSVDEKYPYLYLSCVEAMPEKNIILLMYIPAARDRAKSWLENAIEKRKYTKPREEKNIVLMETIDEFASWARNAFDGYRR